MIKLPGNRNQVFFQSQQSPIKGHHKSILRMLH